MSYTHTWSGSQAGPGIKKAEAGLGNVPASALYPWGNAADQQQGM